MYTILQGLLQWRRMEKGGRKEMKRQKARYSFSYVVTYLVLYVDEMVSPADLLYVGPLNAVVYQHPSFPWGVVELIPDYLTVWNSRRCGLKTRRGRPR